MTHRFIICVGLALFLSANAAAQSDNIRLRLDTGEAEAALAILDARASGGNAPDSLWSRLERSEGFIRLAEREKAMGRALSMEDMRGLLTNDTLLGRRRELRRTLDSWRVLPVGEAGARALAYLPKGTVLEVTVYVLVKPRSNSFVFDLANRPALMLYLDTEVTAPAFANRLAHELHHIGLSAACRTEPPYADNSGSAKAARSWLSAFGEGLAMLAAAGGPANHPHRDSPAADRERWDREMQEAPAQMMEVEQFFLDLLEGRLPEESKQNERGMAFFGVQGPWYTLGYRMGSTVERKFGRDRLIADACKPAQLLLDYNQAVAGEVNAPRWSDRSISRLSTLLPTR